MTILSVGLLALAQLQIMAIQAGSSSRKLSVATNLANQGIEAVKQTGSFLMQGNTYRHLERSLCNLNTSNDAENLHAPAITLETNLSTLSYDSIETFNEDPNTGDLTMGCGFLPYPEVCTTMANDEYIRIVNVRNNPAAEDTNCSEISGAQTTQTKDVVVIVLWKERLKTHSMTLRTMVGRKDDAFF